MKRRYVIVGPIGQQDESGEVVKPGGVITLDDKDERTVTLAELGAVVLESDQPAAAARSMDCPLCKEQGHKRATKLGSQDELEAHYTDKHPGFVVPIFTERGE